VTWRRGLLLPLGLAVIAASPGHHPPSRTHTIEISGMAFHPDTLQVVMGDTVVWVNRDIVPHTSTAAGRTGWDSSQLLQGQRFVLLPRRPGRMQYRCALHPTMTAILDVR